MALPAVVLSHRQSNPISKSDLIVQEILTPQERPIRLPLRRWSADKLNEFTLLRQKKPYHHPQICGAIVDCFNQAALIEVYYGRLDRATALCYGAMGWIANLVNASGRASCFRFTFQPYVNLGRLDRITQRWQDSLNKFQVLDQAVRGHPVCFGPIAIDKKSLGSMAAEFPDVTVLQNIFILDTLKTLLKASWHEKLLEAFPNWRDEAMGAHRNFISEASLVSLCCTQDLRQALELCEECLRNNHETGNRLIFLYRRIEIFRALNDLDSATRLVKKLSSVFAEYRSGLSQNKLIVLAKICRVMISLELPEVEILVQLGLKTASRLCDVFLEREFLQMLAAITSPLEARNGILRRLNELSRASLYGAAGTCEDVCVESIHSLSEQLLNFASSA